MKRGWLGAVVVASLLLLVMPGCTSEPKVMPDAAVVTNNSYDNTYFKFRINLPEGWNALDKETVKELNDVGKKMASGDDKNLESAIEASQKNSYNLFSYFQLPPGTPNVDYNANISCVAERVAHLPGIKTGSDYLENVKMMFGKSQIKADFDPEMKHHVFGQGEMYSIDVVINMMGHEVYQSYYSTVKNGYALAFVVSHADPEQKAEVDKSLASVVFY